MGKMSKDPRTKDGPAMRRVPVVVRSWDGPNSRVGLEMDLGEMPWGPFDALGKRLSLLLPAADAAASQGGEAESQIERALRHVEHAADRCGEFAQLVNGNQDLWLRSQETWEWIRRYLTSLWVETEVDGHSRASVSGGAPRDPISRENRPATVPALPGAASTLRVAASALRATPLAVWREATGATDPDGPTREEAVQTLLGVAKILAGQPKEESVEATGPPDTPGSSTIPASGGQPASTAPPLAEGDADPDQVSFDFAQGYDEGYQMGRRVGLALGVRKGSRSGPSAD